MKNLFIKYSTGKTVLVLFVLANLVYLIMVAITVPKTTQFADGMKLLDLMPGGYDFEYVQSLFTALGEEGRHAYLYTQLPFDMVYPALFALSFSLLLAFFLKKLHRQNSPLIYLCVLPVIGGVADYSENIGIITMLKQYPDLTEQTVKLTSIFSVVKSSATSVYFVALLGIIIWVTINWLRHRKTGV